MPVVHAALAADESRNALILDDILAALEAGRRPLVLTERRDHLERLRDRLGPTVRNLVVLRGGMRSAERKAAEAAMRVAEDEERLVLATGRYLGEGFDDPRLDTLFLTMPISWKGTLAQYVGRLHREHQGKSEVVVHDYVDAAVPDHGDDSCRILTQGLSGRGAEVAFLFLPESCGFGHASEAGRCLLRHVTARHGVRRFSACVTPTNKRSLALCCRLGFEVAEADAGSDLASYDDSDVVLRRLEGRTM